ncbi:MAG: hypothetical protein ACTSRP_20855 [Candidatus Helarchaeota archaeon]
MNSINIDELRKILPKLIKEDDAIRGAIIKALSRVLSTKEDLKDLIAHFDKRFEALQTDFNKRFEALQTDFNKRFEALQTDFNLKKQIKGLKK